MSWAIRYANEQSKPTLPTDDQWLDAIDLGSNGRRKYQHAVHTFGLSDRVTHEGLIDAIKRGYVGSPFWEIGMDRGNPFPLKNYVDAHEVGVNADDYGQNFRLLARILNTQTPEQTHSQLIEGAQALAKNPKYDFGNASLYRGLRTDWRLHHPEILEVGPRADIDLGSDEGCIRYLNSQRDKKWK